MNLTSIDFGNLTLDTTLNGPHVFKFQDVVEVYCTYYSETFATAVILALFCFMFNDMILTKAVYAWQHPQYPLRSVIPLDVRDFILKILETLGVVTNGLGFMALLLLVYFAFMEGMFTLKHWIIFGVCVVFFVFTVASGIYIKLMRLKNARNK